MELYGALEAKQLLQYKTAAAGEVVTKEWTERLKVLKFVFILAAKG